MQGDMMQALGYTIFSRYLFGGIFGLFLANAVLGSAILASAILASVMMPG